MKSTQYIGDMFPGHIIFLLDRPFLNEDEKSNQMVKIVNDFLFIMFNHCNGGFFPACYISTIEYGAVDGCFIRNGWIKDWQSGFSSLGIDDTLHHICFIGQKMLSDALTYANTIVTLWIEQQKCVQEYGERWGIDDDGFLAPIVVINLTKGCFDDEIKIRGIASEIRMRQNTWFYNVIIKDKNDLREELLFPDCINGPTFEKLKPNWKKFQSISSSVSRVYDQRTSMIKDINGYCRAFCISLGDGMADIIANLHFQIGDGSYGIPVDWMDYYSTKGKNRKMEFVDPTFL